MRLIDGDALKEKLQEQQKYGSTADSRGRAKAIVEVIHAPTVEAITLEEFKEKSEQVIEEFVGDNKTTDTELMVHAMLIGLALGNLGLRLFGGSECG